ncbi:MAG TPA: NADP oxidoreductase, partial [Kosmotogaceae bacterium]|nr:NADP oxidoreductase [Kosmotogaceae bacterium]
MNKAITVLVSVDSSSILMGARHYKNYLTSLVNKYNLNSVVEILETGSFGRYDRGVLMMLLPDNVVYSVSSEKDVELFVTEQLLKGRRVDDLI